MTQRPTVLIADDHPIIAEGLAASLREWYDVVGTVTALDQVAEMVRALAPTIVVLDLSFENKSSLRILPDLIKIHLTTHFVILTVHCDPVVADAALHAGAVAFVVKSSAPTELRVAIEEALAGRTYITPLLRERGPAHSTPLPSADAAKLTPIEHRILGLMLTGNTQQQTAEQVGCTRKGVEYHLAKLRGTLGLPSTAQLLRWFERHRRTG